MVRSEPENIVRPGTGFAATAEARRTTITEILLRAASARKPLFETHVLKRDSWTPLWVAF